MVPDPQVVVLRSEATKRELEEVKVEYREQDQAVTVPVLVAEQQLHIKPEFHVIKCPVRSAEQEWSGSR